MPQEVIKFRIKQDGTVEETVEGCTGSACTSLTKNIEEKLGDVVMRKETADMYRSVVEGDYVAVSTQEQHFPGP